MSTTHQKPEPTEHDPPLDDRLTQYLFDLMNIGAKVAQSVGRQADQQAQPDSTQPPVDVADQFERVARAMRRTALLIRHIAQNRAAKIPARTQARKRIIRDVEDAIQRAPRNNQALQAEFLDRLDSLDLEEEIATRPVEHVILDIRRDLGLENILGNHPWSAAPRATSRPSASEPPHPHLPPTPRPNTPRTFTAPTTPTAALNIQTTRNDDEHSNARPGSNARLASVPAPPSSSEN